jgi:hypothetical protein
LEISLEELYETISFPAFKRFVLKEWHNEKYEARALGKPWRQMEEQMKVNT